MPDQSKCPIPGCRNSTPANSLVCVKHGVQIWKHVESVRGASFDTGVIETTASREARLEDGEDRKKAVRKQAGTIYYLRVDEKIKIGWTGGHLWGRLKAYPPHMKLLADHPGTRADERDLHRSFAPSRASGREWYYATPELLAHIDGVIRSQSVSAEEHEMRRKEALANMPGPISRPTGSLRLRGSKSIRRVTGR
jgi:hypothetical protein